MNDKVVFHIQKFLREMFQSSKTVLRDKDCGLID